MYASFSTRLSRRLMLLAFIACLLAGDLFQAAAQGPTAPNGRPQILWKSVEPGFSMARFGLGNARSLLSPEILLLKFSPQNFSFHVMSTHGLSKERTDLRILTKKAGGIAGINANFFDTEGKPLGLVIEEGKLRRNMHAGGNLLSGVFLVEKDHCRIVHRNAFRRENVKAALQAGPRLIVAGRPVKLSSAHASSRRSGVAITTDGEIILFVTLLRFPGASLAQIQSALLNPELRVTDALNLDGGGSSQLYLEKTTIAGEELFVTGGDPVPVGLVVKRK